MISSDFVSKTARNHSIHLKFANVPLDSVISFWNVEFSLSPYDKYGNTVSNSQASSIYQ